jgi:hypothetical protein
MWWLPLFIASNIYHTQGPEAAQRYLTSYLLSFLIIAAFLCIIGIICRIYQKIFHKPLTGDDLTGDKYYCGGIGIDPKKKRCL